MAIKTLPQELGYPVRKETAMEKWVIWGYAKQIVKLSTCPGARLCPDTMARVTDSLHPQDTLFHGRPRDVESQSREVQSVPRGGRLPHLAFAERSRGKDRRIRGPRTPASTVSSRSAPSPAGLPTTTSDGPGQRAAIRRAGAELAPPPETAPRRRPQPQTPT